MSKRQGFLILIRYERITVQTQQHSHTHTWIPGICSSFLSGSPAYEHPL